MSCFFSLQAEHNMAIRDLNMQIEIAHAQRSEFEEISQQLRQDIKDLGMIGGVKTLTSITNNLINIIYQMYHKLSHFILTLHKIVFP